jgi:hypothetical protein
MLMQRLLAGAALTKDHCAFTKVSRAAHRLDRLAEARHWSQPSFARALPVVQQNQP